MLKSKGEGDALVDWNGLAMRANDVSEGKVKWKKQKQSRANREFSASR